MHRAADQCVTLGTRLYALGSNGNNQLGLSHTRDVSVPEKCCFRASPTSTVGHSEGKLNYLPLGQAEQLCTIVSGGNHTLLLTSNGTVWVTGRNDHGQLGLQGFAEVLEGVQMGGNGWQRLSWTGPGASNVTHIAANWETSYFVIDHCIVYACGGNTKGELGIGKDVQVSRKLQQCFNLETFQIPKARIAQIEGCMNHVVVRLSHGQNLYGWGVCRKGQLGAVIQSEYGSSCWTPRAIELQKQPVHLVAGRDFTLVQFEAGHVFLGDPQKLALGIGTAAFEQEMGSEAASCLVHAGWTHVTIQNRKTGSVRGFGKNNKAQILSPNWSAEVQKLAMGSEHSLGQIEDNKLIAWGWGEHGNCGSNMGEDGIACHGPNIIFECKSHQTILGFSAGCATSFIWTSEPVW